MGGFDAPTAPYLVASGRMLTRPMLSPAPLRRSEALSHENVEPLNLAVTGHLRSHSEGFADFKRAETA